jgi:Intracellular proteinase inhibitor
MRRFRWIAVVAGGLTATACSSTLDPVSNTMVGDNQVRLSISASSAEVVRGSPITFHVTLANAGAKPVTLHFRDSCQINPYVRDSGGSIVLPDNGSWGCASTLTELTLASLQSVERDFVWTGSTAFQSEEPLRPLSPGKYLFVAEVPATEGALSAGVDIALK